jgi:hypothetical protein
MAVFAAANSGPADFGWTTYGPLDEVRHPYRSGIVFSDATTVLWTGKHVLGAGLVVLGALVLVGVGGWLLGRRGGRRAVPRP